MSWNTDRIDETMVQTITNLMARASLEEGGVVSESDLHDIALELFRSMVSENPATTFAQFSERLLQIQKRHYMNAVVQLSARIYMLAKERLCFQNLSYIGHLKRFCELSVSLKGRGVQFFQVEGALPTVAMLPELSTRIPWRVLQLACRLQYLTNQKEERTSSPRFQQLIRDCLDARETFMAYREEIGVVLDLITYKELRDDSAFYLAPIEYSFAYWKGFGQSSPEAGEPIQRFMEGMAAHLHRFDNFDKELHKIATDSSGVNEATQRLAHKSLVIQSIFVSLVEQSLSLFQDRQRRESGSCAYAHVYQQLKSQEPSLEGAIDEIVLRCVSPTSPLRIPQQLSTKKCRLPPNISEVLKTLDLRTIPSPEEYRQPLRPFHYRSWVDICSEEYRAEREQASSSAVSSKPTLPPAHKPYSGRSGQRRSAAKIKHRRKERIVPARKGSEGEGSSTLSCVNRPLANDSSVAPSPLPPILPSDDEAVHNGAMTAIEEGKLPLKLDRPEEAACSLVDHRQPHVVASDAREQHQSAASAVPCSPDPSEIDDASGFLVHVGDGPDGSLRYADRVARWADPRRDVFLEDPAYKSKPFSPTIKEEIQFRHAFGRALLPVIMTYGKRFIKHASSAGKPRVSWSIPGEVIRSDRYEKVVFTVSINPKTGHIIHVYATQKTPLTLIMEYAKEGCFPADDAELDQTAFQGSPILRPGYELPDDGSRVTSVSDECITVTQKDGTILNVYPFPEL